MTRSVSSAVQTALNADNIGVIIFVEMLFDSGALRVCSAAYDFDWNGFTWKGLAQLGNIEPIEESSGNQVVGLRFTLSGVDSSLLALAQAEQYQGRVANVYVGFLALPNYTVIVDPILEWAGKMDQMVITDSPDGKSQISVTVENELFDFARPVDLYYTDEDQQRLHPGDNGFKYVKLLDKQQIVWPSAELIAALEGPND